MMFGSRKRPKRGMVAHLTKRIGLVPDSPLDRLR